MLASLLVGPGETTGGVPTSSCSWGGRAHIVKGA